MGICFSSYGNETYAKYSLWLSLYNNTTARQKVVDEATFYFAKLNDDDTYVMTDIKIDGFNMTNLSYYFNDIIAPADKYILVSPNGKILGYKKSNGAIERIELNPSGGTKTVQDVLLYDVPDYASIIYAGNTNLVINVPKAERANYITRYGYEVKVYDGMTAENGWAHEWTGDNVYGARIKSIEFASATKPTTLNSAFKNLQVCTKIDLTNLDTTACTSFFGTFAECRELVDMDITKLIVTDVCTSIGGIFNNCMKYVINSELLHWDTSNVQFFGSAFGNIGNTTFTPKLDTSSGITFNSMFGYNPRITVIDCSTFDTSSAQDLSFMFTKCENLVTIYAKPTMVQPTGVQVINAFTFDEKLVGGMGTVWDAGHVGADRFYIDNLPTQPGYFTDKDAATYKTTLYQNGRLIFNESSQHRDTNIGLYGQVVKEYEPLDHNNNYVFTNPNQVPWKNELTSIMSIMFDQTIQPTSTAYWFYGCTNLTYPDFTNLDTSKVTDMAYMFSGCRTLPSLDLSSFNTSRVTDMTGMFASCQFTSLDLRSFDTRNVVDMDYMFENCDDLSVLQQNFNTSNVVLMEAMFKNCGVQNLDLSNFDTSNVTNMKEMFYGCGDMISLNVSSFDTSNVTDMRSMFGQVGAGTSQARLQTLDLSHFDTSKITDMTSMFVNCAFGNIIVDNWDTSNVTNMKSMFSSCRNITELNLKDFDTSKVTDMSSMFNGSNQLVTIYVSDFDTNLVSTSTNMFFNCTSIIGGAGTTYNATKLDKLYARNDEPPTSPGYFTGKLATALFTDGTLIINEDSDNRETDIATHGAVVKTYGALTSTNHYVFASNADQPWASERTSITDVEFGSVVKPTSTAYWFDGCTALQTQTFANLDTSNTTNMNSMFANCTSLTSLDLSTFNTSKVTDMSRMFTQSTITTIDVSSFDTSKVTVMNSMFSGCGSLTSLDVSNFNTSSVTSMRYMFGNCASLTTIDVSAFDISNVTDITAMFSNCTGATSINLGNFNTSNVTQMFYLFKNCSSLTTLDVSGFDTAKVTTMREMFNGCTNLTALDVSGFNTSRVTMMYGMFYDCESLTQLDLSSFNTSAVTDFRGMFRGCTDLTTIYASASFVTTAATSSGNMFYDCVNIRGGAGTTYSSLSENVDKTRARIDGGTSRPGYFTAKP